MRQHFAYYWLAVLGLIAVLFFGLGYLLLVPTH